MDVTAPQDAIGTACRPGIAPASAITFAIPYYRGLNYLRRAIESVFAQTLPHWRLLICDDGSDEPAADLVARYSDSRVHYIRNPRTLGMAGNWNRCLDLAETELVTLLHADDELLPNYALVMCQHAAKQPDAAGLFCRAVVIDASGRRKFSFPDRVKDVLAGWTPAGLRLAGPDGIARLLRGCFVMCPTLCYRKSRLDPLRFSLRWKMVLDLDLFSRLLSDGGDLIGVPVVAYAYRRHATHATATYNENLLRFREEADLYDEIASQAASRGWHDVARVGREKWMIRLHLAFRTLATAMRGRLWGTAERLRLLWQLSTGMTRRDSPCASP